VITLAVETSTADGSVAIFSDKKIIGEKTWLRSADRSRQAQGSHSELLTASFETLLNEIKLDLSAIQRVAVGIGPGSFTGVRVAVNFARAFAFGQKIPVVPLNSLELLAWQSPLQNYSGDILVIQYAFRDLVYAASYRRRDGQAPLHEISAPAAYTFGELAAKLPAAGLVLGDGLEKSSRDDINSNYLREKKYRDFPQASDFFTFLAQSPGARITDWIHTIPLYIRASEAEEKLKRSY
jgi:tRNA threonylcarbamoyladenosine biosynthesis protein TsaB